MTTDELVQEINLLPIEQRMLFVEYILESLDAANSDIKASWDKEVDRRMKAVNEGSCSVIPSKELHNELYHIIERNK